MTLCKLKLICGQTFFTLSTIFERREAGEAVKNAADMSLLLGWLAITARAN